MRNILDFRRPQRQKSLRGLAPPYTQRMKLSQNKIVGVELSRIRLRSDEKVKLACRFMCVFVNNDWFLWYVLTNSVKLNQSLRCSECVGYTDWELSTDSKA